MAGEPLFADMMFAYHDAESAFSDAMCEAGFGDWVSCHGDAYDTSIEFDGVGNDARLTDEQQRLVFEAGFIRAWLNHHDGSETYYSWANGREFLPAPGSRTKEPKHGG